MRHRRSGIEWWLLMILLLRCGWRFYEWHDCVVVDLSAGCCNCSTPGSIDSVRSSSLLVYYITICTSGAKVGIRGNNIPKGRSLCVGIAFGIVIFIRGNVMTYA